MAQDFERNIARNVGTSEVVLRTANSDDALIGINIANVTTTQILMDVYITCLLYTSPSPRDGLLSRMPSSA